MELSLALNLFTAWSRDSPRAGASGFLERVTLYVEGYTCVDLKCSTTTSSSGEEATSSVSQKRWSRSSVLRVAVAAAWQTGVG